MTTRSLWLVFLLALNWVNGQGIESTDEEELQQPLASSLPDVVSTAWEGVEMVWEAPSHLGDFAGLLFDQAGNPEWTLGERSSACSDVVTMPIPCSNKNSRGRNEEDGVSSGSIDRPALLQKSIKQSTSRSLSSEMETSDMENRFSSRSARKVSRRTSTTTEARSPTNSSDVCGMWMESCGSKVWCNSFRLKFSTEVDAVSSVASRMYVLSKPIYGDEECPLPPRDAQFQSANLKQVLEDDSKAFHFRRL